MRIAVVCIAVVLAHHAAAADELGFRDVVNRIGVSVVAGDGWNANYPGHSESTAVSGGVLADIVAGVDNFGVVLAAGLLVDGGTTPDATMMPIDRLWLVDLGLGIESAPYALVKREDFELRLHVGLRGSLIKRTTCDPGRCEMFTEPDLGAVGVGSAGVLAWFGDGRNQGFGFDLVFMRGKIGNLRSGDDNAELVPPTLLVRLSWLPYRGRRR